MSTWDRPETCCTPSRDVANAHRVIPGVKNPRYQFACPDRPQARDFNGGCETAGDRGRRPGTVAFSSDDNAWLRTIPLHLAIPNFDGAS